MQRFFWILVTLFASVWIGLKISEDPGYAVFAYRHWTIEMPLWFAIICFILFVIVFYNVLRLADNIDFSLYRWKNWLQNRRKHKAYSKTNRGLIELIEGHWKSAEHYLLNGVDQSEAPLINYLAAAVAAHEQGAYDRCEAYLRKAHHSSPNAEVAIGLTQAQLQLKQGQLEQTLATLGHLRQIAPKHGLVLKLLERVYVHLSDWKGLIKLLPNLRKAKLITDDQMEALEEKAYQELLCNAAARHEGLLGIQRVWETIPKKMRKHTALIKCYIQLILPYPEMASEIDSLITKTLKKTWDKDLVKYYGNLTTNNPSKQLAQAESWLQQYGNNATLLQTLGRLCMNCQLWGKARTYFEESLKLEMNPDTCLEYGQLLEKISAPSEALENYRLGLQRVTRGIG